jgi:glycosyltransferase involved in cell wall biosynthesis
MPFFSIIISTYFRPKLCIQAINSVISQKFTNYELIIICHGKNNYINYLQNNISQKKNIKYFYLKDVFLSSARNYGAKKAQGSWLAFLDDDDMWLPEKLVFCAEAINAKKNLDIVYHDFKIIDLSTNKIIKKHTLADYTLSYPSLDVALQFSNYVSGGSACAIRKKRFIDLGLFDETLGGCEDHDLWRRAINQRYVFYFIDKKLTVYGKLNNNLSKNIKNQIKFEALHGKKTLNELPHYLSHYYYDIEIYNLKRTLFLFFLGGNLFIFFSLFFNARFTSKILFFRQLPIYFFLLSKKLIYKTFYFCKKFNQKIY